MNHLRANADDSQASEECEDSLSGRHEFMRGAVALLPRCQIRTLQKIESLSVMNQDGPALSPPSTTSSKNVTNERVQDRLLRPCIPRRLACFGCACISLEIPGLAVECLSHRARRQVDSRHHCVLQSKTSCAHTKASSSLVRSHAYPATRHRTGRQNRAEKAEYKCRPNKRLLRHTAMRSYVLHISTLNNLGH